MRPRYLAPAIVLLLTLLTLPVHVSAEAEDIWLLVDTSELTLSVMKGDSEVKRYDNIAIGSNGPTLTKLVSDETTPLGEFRINRINFLSRYHLFFAIDYPTMDHATRALADGRLGPEEYIKVSNAWLADKPPPQTTALGGYLGIHGIGNGDEDIHGIVNWTDGCIAVTNEQIEELARWAGLGTRVSVR